MTAPYPPHVQHSTHAVPTDEALALLQSYLTDSETKPWLHPDAMLSESGPQFARTTSGGLILHNLRRVEAGLRGERLGTELSLAELTAETGMNYDNALEGRSNNINAVVDDDRMAVDEDRDEWQDIEEFRREQDVDEGDVERRENVVVNDGGQVPRLLGVDRETRKREKKERRKQEKRERNEGRRRERDMDGA